jgi:hypothetical protein
LVVRLHSEAPVEKPKYGEAKKIPANCQKILQKIERQFLAIGTERPFPGEPRFTEQLWGLHFSKWRVLFGVLAILPFALRNTFDREHRQTETKLIGALLGLYLYVLRLQSRRHLPDQQDVEFGKR